MFNNAKQKIENVFLSRITYGQYMAVRIMFWFLLITLSMVFVPESWPWWVAFLIGGFFGYKFGSAVGTACAALDDRYTVNEFYHAIRVVAQKKEADKNDVS